jgi:hypothetical protein
MLKYIQKSEIEDLKDKNGMEVWWKEDLLYECKLEYYLLQEFLIFNDDILRRI